MKCDNPSCGRILPYAATTTHWRIRRVPTVEQSNPELVESVWSGDLCESCAGQLLGSIGQVSRAQ